jgi:hypothetical protein
MSGIKVSPYHIEQERLRRIQAAQRERERIRQEKERIRQEKAEQNRLLSNINQQKKVINTTANSLKELLKNTPQGLKETFSEPVQNAERWMENVLKIIENDEKSRTNASLQHHLGKIHSERERGQHFLKDLTKTLTKTADAMANNIFTELTDVKATFEENKELIIKWDSLDGVNNIAKDINKIDQFLQTKKLTDAAQLTKRVDEHLKNHIKSIDNISEVFSKYEQNKEVLLPWFEGETKKIDKEFDNLKNVLGQSKYSDLSKSLTQMQKRIETKTKEAQELEVEDQKRQYVLESLKKVCESMGFEEVEQSVEGIGKESRIKYTVDTFSQGNITFYLSLEEIKADSAIIDKRCMSEFEKISEDLKKNFGVHTKFQRVSEVPNPKKIRKDEIGGSGEEEVKYGSEGNI